MKRDEPIVLVEDQERPLIWIEPTELDVERLARALDFASDDPWPGSLTTAEFAYVVARAYLSDIGPTGLPCTYKGCGKPERDSIHPGPDERMGGGRHVYRHEP